MRSEILSILESDAKVSVQDIAMSLNIDEALVIDEIAKMEAEKIICGYATLIDWDKTAHEVTTALIEVKVTPQRGEGFDKIARRIYNYDEVSSIYLMSGGFDFTVIINGRSMKEVARFVSEKLAPLEHVQSTATHFVLKKYKDFGIVMESRNKAERIPVMC
ncbi:MAG: Lrp/AsnC family transcriptional regulator [Eubacteriales bacterium]|nr:Lrp/AsnC family transcriptional regulator [Eubacteriales bacterium]